MSMFAPRIPAALGGPGLQRFSGTDEPLAIVALAAILAPAPAPGRGRAREADEMDEPMHGEMKKRQKKAT